MRYAAVLLVLLGLHLGIFMQECVAGSEFSAGVSSPQRPSTDDDDAKNSGPALAADAGGKDTMAVCFFGLTRSLRKYTYPSIKTFLLDRLVELNFTTHVFLHTYALDFITNPRAKEQNVPLDREEWRLLDPMIYEIEELVEVDAELAPDYATFIEYGNAWPDDRSGSTTLKNLIRQLRSIRRCWDMIERHVNNTAFKYQHILFARPDVRYLTPLPDIRDFLPCKARKGRPPHRCLGVAYGDRFAVGAPEEVKVWATRGDYAKEYVTLRDRPLHSESLVDYIMRKNHMKAVRLPLCFERVRANGEVRRSDGKVCSGLLRKQSKRT